MAQNGPRVAKVAPASLAKGKQRGPRRDSTLDLPIALNPPSGDASAKANLRKLRIILTSGGLRVRVPESAERL